MQSLATKYRPQKFEDVCEQSSIIKILKRQLDLGEFKNTYLFCGASGCGKTTVARIFANEINKHIGSPIEIDGASNNGVDNVKAIIKSATERSLESEYKIVIMDECHALTNQAWQAFLKTIEEPPKYTIFIFCTTDPQKIPPTILNRVMRFNFNKISYNKIYERLCYISQMEGFTNYQESCDYISKIGNGGMRDSIALLEKCASYSIDLSINNVLEALGNYSYDVMFDLVNKTIDRDINSVISILNFLYNQGNDLKLFIDTYLSFCLDISKYIITKDCSVVKIPSSMEDKLKNSINFDNADKYYYYLIDKLLELKNMLKNDNDTFSTIQVMFIKMTRCV